MNSIQTAGGHAKVPNEMTPFVAKCPRLLPGESEEKYHTLFELMVDEIEPQQATEWLVLDDIVSLFWDIERYRRWKGAILNIHRYSALETALRETHPSYAFAGDRLALFNIARTEAEEWRTDPMRREVLNERMAAHGYDEEAINAGALLAALAPLTTIDRFLASARGQLNAMLKEICVRREFADRARKALKEYIHGGESSTPPKQIATQQ